MWLDECSAERGAGKKREWVFRTPVQKWHRAMIQTYHKGKDISVMVWGCFWGGGRSELYVMDRDPESKRNGYSANSYIEVLDDQLPSCWVPGLTFMQDNASIHTAHKVRNWFIEQGIPVCEWPPYSPDLNPIEHVWKRLKEMVFEMHPELTNVAGDEPAREALGNALREAWDAIPQEFFDRLIETMENRVKAVIKADGWHTKY
jgi:hypothetical protein